MATPDPRRKRTAKPDDSIARTIRASPTRREILALLERKPGLNPHQIAKHLGYNPNSVRFQIGRLEDVRLIVSRHGRIGRERICFTPENVHLWDNPSTRILYGRGPPRKVAHYLVDNPGKSIGEISKALGISPHTVRDHIRTLEEYHLIQRIRVERYVFYHPENQLVDWVETIAAVCANDHLGHTPEGP